MVGTVVIKRVFNNNVAMVTSDDGSELIVIGRGLCFGRHAGDAIDEASIEKTYALQEGTSQDSRTIDRLAHLLESIPTVNLVIAGWRAQTWCKSVLRSVAASPDVTPS